MIKNIITSLVVSTLVLCGFLFWNSTQQRHPKGLMATPASRAAMTAEINNNIFTNGLNLITATSVNSLLKDFLGGVTAFSGDSPIVLPNPVTVAGTITQTGNGGTAVVSGPASGTSHFQWPTTDGINGQVLGSLNPPATEWVTVSNSALSQKGYINGLWLSSSGNNLGVGAGVAIDTTNLVVMTNGVPFNKSLVGPWAAGHAGKCLDTGSVANNTWYHIFVVNNTGFTDLLCSLSATAPTMPTGYTQFRRIGAVRTDGSANIVPFTQIGNDFYWTTSFQDVNVGTLGVAPALFTLAHVPTGVNVKAHFEVAAQNVTVQGVSVYSPLVSTATINMTCFGNVACSNNYWEMTNTSGQIGAVAQVASTTFQVNTLGYEDQRGSQ